MKAKKVELFHVDFEDKTEYTRSELNAVIRDLQSLLGSSALPAAPQHRRARCRGTGEFAKDGRELCSHGEPFLGAQDNRRCRISALAAGMKYHAGYNVETGEYDPEASRESRDRHFRASPLAPDDPRLGTLLEMGASGQNDALLADLEGAQ